ncbi:MFS transporter [Streptomyces albipurpureus]|nr:MFS transporter [Streptomyces sp. CWNU-1]
MLALPTVVLSMDLTVLHLAAPAVSADLRPSGGQLLWILDIYGFLVAGSLITMGTLGDRIGRRRLLLLGAGAFIVASLMAAFAPSAELLILARALLGVAGATLMPSTLALLTGMFPDPVQRSFAIAGWMTCFTVGEAIGPLVGGILLEWFWWGSVFVIGVPVMLLLLVTGPLLLPEHRDTAAPGRLDPLSVGLSLVAALSIVYGAKQLAGTGLGWFPLLSILVGSLSGVVFVRRQRTLSAPLLDLGLLKLAGFRAALGTQTLAVCAVAGSQLLVIQYFQAVLGLSPLAAGLWTVPSVVLGIGATLLAPRLARRLGPGVVISTGLFTAAVGAAMIVLTAHQASLAWTVSSFSILYTGVTPTLALTTDHMVGAAPPARAGAASGLSQSGAELGLAAGMALLGSVAMAVYQARLATSAPAGLDHRSLLESQETVGGALDVAERHPGEVGNALRAAIDLAVSHGLQTAAVLAMAGFLGAALLAAISLRDRGTSTAGPGPVGNPDHPKELRR